LVAKPRRIPHMRHERRFRPAAAMIRCLMTTQEILDNFALLDDELR